MNQLTIFEFVELEEEKVQITENYKVNALVKVKLPSAALENTQLEDYYYLRDFANKTGRIISIHLGLKICYTVDFGGYQGIFYHNDLIHKIDS
ncbi:hypothetical protein M3936_19790 [Sutcliffiella horikoshii]|uniref:hypothetical protein n=1 Tax=Sutcliffiella horikoshii TaxID=79883 RepID=UPI001CBB02B2|nr:hypothetical protein [Sutcliffiella horikoshii]MCM3619817.1 hypothetical protein [Sutcliffiella horikoshii]UAL49831.1 hypothetical protein K7887_22185 [Sutcliffiella horikoshii]